MVDYRSNMSEEEGNASIRGTSRSVELNRSSLGRHNKTSKRQNRESRTSSWLATLEEEAPTGGAAKPKMVTPAFTVTHPAEELGGEEVLVPTDEDEPIEVKEKTGHRGVSVTSVVDQPILEEDEEKKDGRGSKWSRARSRALSSTNNEPGSTLRQALLQMNLSDQGTGRVEGDEGACGGQRPLSMVKFVEMALMAKRWKNRSNEGATPIRTSKETLADRQKRRSLVEIPRCLKQEVLEEAHQIVHKTLQKYRSELGLHHKLTLQAEQHCENLEEQLGHTHNHTH